MDPCPPAHCEGEGAEEALWAKRAAAAAPLILNEMYTLRFYEEISSQLLEVVGAPDPAAAARELRRRASAEGGAAEGGRQATAGCVTVEAELIEELRRRAGAEAASRIAHAYVQLRWPRLLAAPH